MSLSMSLSLSLAVSFCLSGHVSSSLWSNVRRVTTLSESSLVVFLIMVTYLLTHLLIDKVTYRAVWGQLKIIYQSYHHFLIFECNLFYISIQLPLNPLGLVLIYHSISKYRNTLVSTKISLIASEKFPFLFCCCLNFNFS